MFRKIRKYNVTVDQESYKEKMVELFNATFDICFNFFQSKI